MAGGQGFPLSTTPSQPVDTPRDARWRVADYIHAHRDAIKAGFREQIASQDRSFFDSSDFFSTVQRRVDLAAALGGVDDAAGVRRLLQSIMREALTDHARATVRDRRLRRDLARDARRTEPETPRTGEIPPESRLKRLHLTTDELDLARLRASGMLHRQVAQAMGVSAEAIRTKWQRLVGKAREARSQAGG